MTAPTTIGLLAEYFRTAGAMNEIVSVRQPRVDDKGTIGHELTPIVGYVLRNEGNDDSEQQELLTKVPEVTLVFWIIKILATTLGQTGGIPCRCPCI